MHFEYGSVV